MRCRAAAIVVGVLGSAMMMLGVAACGGRSVTGSDTTTSPSPSRSNTTLYADTKVPTKPTKAVGDFYKARSLAGPLWRFGLDLLTRQAAKTGENVVVSPVSLSAVLSMTLNGARGETAAQMRRTLRLESLQPQQANQAWADLIRTSNATNQAQVRIADSLWLRNGIPYIPAFLAANRDYFAADTRNLPADLAQAPGEINDWVAQRTGNRIKDLLSSLSPKTALVLVNTVYAKVGWKCFDEKQTGPKPFTLGDGTVVQVPTMHGLVAANVAATAEYDAVPVETNGELTFRVIVPKGSQTPESVAGLLNRRGVGSLNRHPTYATVDLRLPRSRIEYASQKLNDDLAAMGMPDAFSPAVADFSGMAGMKRLWIDSVIQKTMIDVNEQGIEAAAGSAVVMWGTGGPPTKRLTVHADRPFLVVLAGQFTEAPLFMAIVRDPR